MAFPAAVAALETVRYGARVPVVEKGGAQRNLDLLLRRDKVGAMRARRFNSPVREHPFAVMHPQNR